LQINRKPDQVPQAAYYTSCLLFFFPPSSEGLFQTSPDLDCEMSKQRF